MVSIDMDKEKEICSSVDDKSEEVNEHVKNLNFKKRLICKVREHRVLYDNRHKHFSNVAKKELLWQQVADKLKSTVDECKDTWFKLRHDYQRYARRLRIYFIQGRKQNLKRPVMCFESELMFLWRFVENRKTSKSPIEIASVTSSTGDFEVVTFECQNPIKPDEIENDVVCVDDDKIDEQQSSLDEDLILVEQPVELIVIDEDDEPGKGGEQYKLTTTMRLLIQEIKKYPELYNTAHVAFKNYTRKSYVWNTIAGNLSDKATKLMKCWIILQTRYEWEICQPKHKNDTTVSELQVQLDFLKNCILKNPNTVYKQSYYLKQMWYDPIDYFKDIYNLIVRMKKIPDIVNITDSLLNTSGKSKQYLSFWRDIASLKGGTAGQCETTWLAMRLFYWELMFMREQSYQLTDKWYFETIITELYALAKATQDRKEAEQLAAAKQYKPPKKANKRTASTSATSLGAPSAIRPCLPPTTMPTTPTILNNLQQSVAVTNSTLSAATTAASLNTFPKITSAISLAPQSLNTSGSLQIKAIPGPPVLSPAPQAHHLPHSSTLVTAAPPLNATNVPPPMSMSFNLPNQTKVTPIQMPPLRSIAPAPPAVSSNTQALIMVRPRSAARMPTPKIQPAPWAALPASKTYAIANPQQTLDLQPSPEISSISNTSANANTTITTTQSIAAFKVTTLPSTSVADTTSSITPLSNSTSIAIPSTSLPSTSSNGNELPKITGAISLLNPNEILIELISSQTGNQLVVHGPPLVAKYQLSMPTVAKFIREVLAIPLLHNKRNNAPPSLINNYWDHIATKFQLPVHICRACWNFLLENFNHFPQIAPLKELMKPFHTSLEVWAESNTLFKQFDEHCVAKGWLMYMPRLPEVVECISSYPILYKDVGKTNSDENTSYMEKLCVWRTISLRFPKIADIPEIWSALKNCFCQYMADLECAIDNKWPINWWRALARLKFLVEAKYSTNEPFYYIVSNKMVEEIERCAMHELRIRYKTANGSPIPDSELVPIEKNDNDNDNNDLANKESFAISFEMMEENYGREVKMESQNKSANNSSNLNPQIAPSEENNDMNIILQIDSEVQKRKEIEFGALITAMQKYPIIYGKGDNLDKYEAWKKVAQELHMEVVDCLQALKEGVRKYFAYKKQDINCRCRINEKYYKKFNEIVHSLPCGKLVTSCGKLNIRTPYELNQSMGITDNTPDLVFPERYISDINLSNSPINLVVKNWSYALGHLPYIQGDAASSRFKAILRKHIPEFLY